MPAPPSGSNLPPPLQATRPDGGIPPSQNPAFSAALGWAHAPTQPLLTPQAPPAATQYTQNYENVIPDSQVFDPPAFEKYLLKIKNDLIHGDQMRKVIDAWVAFNNAVDLLNRHVRDQAKILNSQNQMGNTLADLQVPGDGCSPNNFRLLATEDKIADKNITGRNII